MQLKEAETAPFRLSVRLTNSRATGLVVSGNGMSGSHLARRRPSDSKLDATPGKRRDESGPPTKPSVVPPSGSVLRNTEHSALQVDPLRGELERTAPTLTYGLLMALGGTALGGGALMAAWSGGREVTWIASTLWFLAASTLLFSLSMALLLTLSFTRRLRALARAAERLAHPKSEPMTVLAGEDAIVSLARSVSQMSERITRLTGEIEQCVEEEQARVDELVRERTRGLAQESDDLRLVLGDSKGLLSIDREGRIVGAASSVLLGWLGAAPRGGRFWEYFEQASPGAGLGFEAAWEKIISDHSGEPELKRLPKSLAVSGRYLALDYKAVHDAGGNLERVLAVLSDITISEPSPADPRPGASGN